MYNRPLVVHRNGMVYHLENLEPTGSTVVHDLGKFADLLQSPEGVYSFYLSALSAWSAAAKGISAEFMKDLLEEYSENEVPGEIYERIEWGAGSFRKLKLLRDGEGIKLTSEDAELIQHIAALPDIPEPLAQYEDTNALWFSMENRKTLKEFLYTHDYFVIDECNIIGEPLYMCLKIHSRQKGSITLKPYQSDAVAAYLDHHMNIGGNGSIIMPPNCGKTIVALSIMAELQLTTLVLVENDESAQRWMDEISSKTDLAPGTFLHWTDSSDPLAPVTVCKYSDAIKYMDSLCAFKWGMIVYDDGHKFPAYIETTDIPSEKKLGLASTTRRSDNRGYLLFLLVGAKLYEVSPRTLESRGFLPKVSCTEILVPLTRDTFINARAKQDFAKNPQKRDAFEIVMQGTMTEKVLIHSFYVDIAQDYQRYYQLSMITGDTDSEDDRHLLSNFQRGAYRIAVVTQKAERYDFGDVTLVVSLSYNQGSEREEYLRLGKLLHVEATTAKRRKFISLVSADCVEETDYAKRRQELIRHGYRFQVYTLEELQDGVVL
ncbi:helicase-associated domain-containing protein [Alicyclobacillus tolerans]|uniref:helicase-associated domain-containing protein n=1 Tax=Alicyclobacillus tolerans TaxID=90970 RepID=UPI001F164188|nr:helicase-associated domain-containing protein [Alicyclobacillus tolerans]MCF8567675.1 helicase-associated domain-containing protein [Alicyclobacillus tolerans]